MIPSQRPALRQLDCRDSWCGILAQASDRRDVVYRNSNMLPRTTLEPNVAPPAREEPEIRAGDLAAPPPPRLSGAPLLGNLPEFLRDPYGMFIRGYRDLGPVFSTRFVGRRLVVLAGPESLRFLSKQGRELLNSKPVWHEFVSLFGGERSLVSADGEFHAELRKRLRPSMSRSTLEKRVPEVRDAVDRCLERWD